MKFGLNETSIARITAVLNKFSVVNYSSLSDPELVSHIDRVRVVFFKSTVPETG